MHERIHRTKTAAPKASSTSAWRHGDAGAARQAALPRARASARDVTRPETPGQPLPAHTRAFMEPRFDHDFSAVRVHADSEAISRAAGLGARAFTVGDHISFGDHEFAPDTRAGRTLIAHELAHVAQNRGYDLPRRSLEPTS